MEVFREWCPERAWKLPALSHIPCPASLLSECSPVSFIISFPNKLIHGDDLKQIDCQVFLRQRWVYLGSAENCNPRSATLVEPHACPQQARERECFYWEEKEVQRARASRVQGFSLADCFPGKKSLLSFY